MNSHVLLRDAGPFANLVMSVDGRTLVVAHRDGHVTVFSLAGSVREETSFSTGLASIHQVALDPTGTRLAVAGRGPLQVHALPDGALLGAWNCGAGRDLFAVAWEPQGRSLLVAGDDESLRLVRADDGSVLDACLGAERTTSIVFHPDARTFAVTLCWERESAVCFGSVVEGLGLLPSPLLRRSSQRLYPAGFSPDGRHLAFADADVHLHSWPDGRRLHTFDASGERVEDAVAEEPAVAGGRWSPPVFGNQGKCMACANSGGVLYVWNVASGALERVVEAHAGPVSALAASPITGALFTAGGDRVVRCWEGAFGGAEEASD